MRENGEPLLEEPLDPELAALRRLLHDAGSSSVPPGGFDLAEAVRGGHRRARRRRTGQVLTGVAAAALVTGLAALPHGVLHSGPPPAAPSPTPTTSGAPSPSPTSSAAEGGTLARVLADPAAGVSDVVFTDAQHASARLYLCPSTCTSYALITADAWRTWHALPAPDGGGETIPLSDGSVLVGSGDGTGRAVVTLLHPEGSTARVAISPVPVPFSATLDILPRLPFLSLASGSKAPFWTYDATTSTLHPVDLAPPGYPLTTPVLTPDGTLVVVSRELASATGPALVARSADSGRTWISEPLLPKGPDAGTLLFAASGVGGQLAAVFGPPTDGSNPFGQLQVSTDGGRHWTVSAMTGGSPSTVSGLAWTSGSALLLAEDAPGRVWIRRAGQSLQPAAGAPAGQTAIGTLSGIVSTQTSPRQVFWTVDGRRWSAWTLPTSVPDPDSVLVATPGTPGKGR
ncbi:MAG: WD40/YVTN/BNR-like repeat-containing protein [Motilibacteraceae bacterium]